MKKQMCSRCGERPAVVFIQKMEDGKIVPEGLCIKCAKEKEKITRQESNFHMVCGLYHGHSEFLD